MAIMVKYVLNVPKDMRVIHTLAMDAKVFIFLCVLAFILQCPSGLASVLGLSNFLLNRTVHVNKQNYVLLLYETTSVFNSLFTLHQILTSVSTQMLIHACT
jgi:hypothetical protein